MVQMELEGGLGGYAVSGHKTEIEIRFFASATINGQVEIHDAIGQHIIPMQLHELQQKKFWQVVTTDQHKPVIVKWIPEIGASIEKKIYFEVNPALLSVFTDSDQLRKTLDILPSSNTFSPVTLSPGNLPHSVQAYDAVEVLITDKETLAKLSKAQIHALGDYLIRCNIVLLKNSDSAFLQQIKDISGCSGRLVEDYQRINQLPPLLAQLKSVPAVKLPAPNELIPLVQKQFQQHMSTSLVLYLSGYILFMALLTWRIKKSLYLMLLPAVFSITGIFSWSGAGTLQQISWAEAESEDSHIKITSLLLLGGNRQGNSRINIDASHQLTHIMNQPSAHILYSQNRSNLLLRSYSPLLSPQQFQVTSVVDKLLPYSLNNNLPVPLVTFQDKVAIDDARLLWRGHFFDIPRLLKGNSWQPDITLGKPANSAAEKLLQNRLAYNAPAVLLPFNPVSHDFQVQNINTAGWLVIRHKPQPS